MRTIRPAESAKQIESGISTFFIQKLRSSETGTQTDRPKLTVTYGTRTPVTAVDGAVTVTYQHRDGGLYSNTDDAWINELSTANNAALERLLRIRGYHRQVGFQFPDALGFHTPHEE